MELGPKGGIETFKKRRQRLLDKTKDGVVVIPAFPEIIRNNDVPYPYRQDSTFYYLTGFTEPESVIVLDASSETPFTLFVRERDPSKELWDGFRYGLEGAQKYFAADKVYPIKELRDRLPELLKGTEKIFYKMGENQEFDKTILEGIDKAKRLKGRSGLGAPSLIDIKALVGEMRLFKSRDEIEWLRKACEISSLGHIAGMKASKPGVMEYQVEAEIESEFRRRGAERLGYGSIVGTGVNATVLHYVFNCDPLKDGDLLLVDAGAEYNYLTGDITRTYPVNGRFSPPQKKLYNAVLTVQKECVAMIKPGVKFHDIHARAVEGLTESLLQLGILKGNRKEIIEKGWFRKYFPHGTSHWLGMDVHDSGLYYVQGESRKLEAGMCFTVEPGLYVPANDTEAPAEFRGLGIRIEDDVAVTSSGVDNLTKTCPKEIEELEHIIGKAV